MNLKMVTAAMIRIGLLLATTGVLVTANVADHPVVSNSLTSTEGTVTTPATPLAQVPEVVPESEDKLEEEVSSSTSTTSTTTTTTTESTTTTSTTSTTTLPTTTTTLVPPTNQFGCYNADPDLCRTHTGDCECAPDPTIPDALYCCNATDINKAISCADGSWKYIHMRNLTVRELVLNVSNRYIKTLLSLSITDGSIHKISSSLARYSSPLCLNISNNNISEIQERAFKELRNLTMLDISHNNLSSIPIQYSTLTPFRWLDVRENKPMLCKHLLEAVKHNITFVQEQETFCLTSRTFNWFESEVVIRLQQLQAADQLQQNCPRLCRCELERLNFDLNNTEKKTITAKVNCSGLNFTDFPETLPPDTVTLDVSNNNITSLKALNGKSYQSLVRLYADDNQITSLGELEGTGFLSHFTFFAIRRNKLRTIQTYLLKLDLGTFLFLEGNSMTCDCNAAKNFKNWLLSKKAQVPDQDLILCEGTASSSSHQVKMVQILESKLCQSQHDWTDYIYYVIAIEIILLVALVCKVSYDYWVFKTAGYLPWPANKMPKLPCDCLCE
ncbi:hypothetical protein pipiens_016162 [Culex pipiens pipiens]|uniref:Protein halfway n=1 Tax=Culex pipiens pipiens TaxID=38569 RepID=A0ABD1CMI2_CULPP